MEFVHPDDRKATLEAIQELDGQKPVLNFVNRYMHKNGSYRYIEWRSYPKDKLIYAAARDITERIKAEKKIIELSKAVEYNPATVKKTEKGTGKRHKSLLSSMRTVILPIMWR